MLSFKLKKRVSKKFVASSVAAKAKNSEKNLKNDIPYTLLISRS